MAVLYIIFTTLSSPTRAMHRQEQIVHMDVLNNGTPATDVMLYMQPIIDHVEHQQQRKVKAGSKPFPYLDLKACR